jgi:predicted DNA binding protein
MSQRLPDLTSAYWCNRDNHAIEISSANEGDRAKLELKESVRILREFSVAMNRKTFSTNRSVFITQLCNCNPSSDVLSFIERHNCLGMQPIVLRRGWAVYRMLAFEQSDVRKLFGEFDKLGWNYEIISRRPMGGSPMRESFSISIEDLLGDLTRRQAYALFSALYRGYYDVPKRISAADIAKSVGLPRTTFEQHLRKAESKAMKALLPLLTFSGASTAVRTSDEENSRMEEPAAPRIQF